MTGMARGTGRGTGGREIPVQSGSSLPFAVLSVQVRPWERGSGPLVMRSSLVVMWARRRGPNRRARPQTTCPLRARSAGKRRKLTVTPRHGQPGKSAHLRTRQARPSRKPTFQAGNSQHANTQASTQAPPIIPTNFACSFIRCSNAEITSPSNSCGQLNFECHE